MAEANVGPGDTHGIQHVIVLMLENRSYDHLLGYHPTVGTLHACPESCPAAPGSMLQIATTDEAGPTLSVGPAHSHEEVMRQVTGTLTTKTSGSSYSVPVPAPMDGFVASYRSLEGAGSGDEIMHCFAPDHAPVVSRLASEFAVFDRWFASVPGETWPNRNFVHSGTSDGEVNISTRLYDDETIFDRLGDEWAIYHQGFPQVWAFKSLWKLRRIRRFRGLGNLIHDIGDDNLRAYSFVEPDHGLQWGEHGNSQHPNENEKSGHSFVAGEVLIAKIYNALVANPEVFDKTLFIVTYDEHGGFFDHVPPVAMKPPNTMERSGFDFGVSGVRVPAIVINPRVRAEKVSTPVDHTAIPRTVRALFAPSSQPLGDREAASAIITELVTWVSGRRCEPVPVPDLPERAWFLTAGAEEPLDEFQQTLVDLAVLLQDEPKDPHMRGVAPEDARGQSPLEQAARQRSMTIEASEQLTTLVAALQDDY